MDSFEAKILLRNLVGRISSTEEGGYQLPGVLTDAEVEALNLALSLFDGPQSPAVSESTPATTAEPPQQPIAASPLPEFEEPTVSERKPDYGPVDDDPDEPIQEAVIDLDFSALEASPPPPGVRLCLDFGTAMSKATLVKDQDEHGYEEIHVLTLGVPGDQEEISENMLISSVFIDEAGLLWFGKEAVDRSMLEDSAGSRQRLDNIKRRLSEEGWDEVVTARFNPTDTKVTNGELVLAYLMYMTWAVNKCLEDMGYPWNLPRRFAMPCLPGEKGRETIHRLQQLVGEAQVLAGTFFGTLNSGVPLDHFIAAVRALRKSRKTYDFVAEDITEPLGVAGSILSWTSRIDALVMVVDVGAGTSDFSLYRLHFDPATDANIAIEIEDSSRGITEAGNHLDQMLTELIMRESGVTSSDPMSVNIRGELALRIRDFKESLFNDGFLYVSLMNGAEVEIELSEFLSLPQVAAFGENLRKTMVEILESVDQSWINWITANPARKLVVALTGGGAELPMVKDLASNDVTVNGKAIPVAQARSFPDWLRELDENLEADYPRVAVSLGGARRRLIERGASARVTAGDVGAPGPLGGYFTRGT